MFAKNLKHYRLMRNLSMSELAERTHLSANAIKKYEHGQMMPSSTTLQSLSKALGVKSMQLLQTWSSDVRIQPGPYRGRETRTQRSVEAVASSIEFELGKYCTVLSLLPARRLPVPKGLLRIQVADVEQIERAAADIRKHLSIPAIGPMPDMVMILENLGYLVIDVPNAPSWFDAQYGHVNDRPYIALAADRPPDRQRHTLAHEIGHACLTTVDVDDEDAAGRFGGALLLPKEDMHRELGHRRPHGIAMEELRFLQREYRVSMKSIIKRARQLDILSQPAEVALYKRLGGLGLTRDEEADIPKEIPSVYRQLVVQLTIDEEISITRGAELLRVDLPTMNRMLYGPALA